MALTRLSKRLQVRNIYISGIYQVYICISGIFIAWPVLICCRIVTVMLSELGSRSTRATCAIVFGIFGEPYCVDR